MRIAKEELEQRIRATASIPMVSVQALRLLNDTNASIQEVAQCFRYDPGITANIIKIANSSLFPSVVKAGTLQEAIVRMGFRQTLQLLLGMSLAPVLRAPVSGYGLESGQLWDAAISGAIFAEIISRKFKLKTSDLLFTCCMLRDVGKIILGSFLAQERQLAEGLEGQPFDMLEQEVFGIDHAEAGAILMESWHMPGEFAAAARWHHRPAMYSGPQSIAMIVKIVHVADILSYMAGDNDGVDGMNYRLDGETAAALGISCELADIIIYEHKLKYEELKTAGVL